MSADIDEKKQDSVLSPELRATIGDTTLLKALHQGDWDSARDAIRQNLGIHTVTPTLQWNALHFATFYAAPIDIVHEVIRAGVDVNAVTSSGASPLFFAAQFNLFAICKVLMEFGADTDIVSSVSGATAFHACISDETSRELLEVMFGHEGGKVNAKAQPSGVAAILKQLGKDSSDSRLCGATPLILAVQKGLSKELIEVLLEQGCDPYIQDDHGKTAVDYARSKTELSELVSLLDIPPTDLEPRRCHFCGRISQVWLPRCAGCDQVVYCNRQCQKADWVNHKKICKKVSNS